MYITRSQAGLANRHVHTHVLKHSRHHDPLGLTHAHPNYWVVTILSYMYLNMFDEAILLRKQQVYLYPTRVEAIVDVWPFLMTDPAMSENDIGTINHLCI